MNIANTLFTKESCCPAHTKTALVANRVTPTPHLTLTPSTQNSNLCRTIMRWPPWSTPSKHDEDVKRSVSWTDSLNATDWTHYTDPRTVIPTILLTGTTLFLVRLYRFYLRRIPEAASIQPGFFRRRSLFGRVTSVGDGDNFRLFHTPGGRLTGWGWIPGRKVPQKRDALKDRTVRSRTGYLLLRERCSDKAFA